MSTQQQPSVVDAPAPDRLGPDQPASEMVSRLSQRWLRRLEQQDNLIRYMRNHYPGKEAIEALEQAVVILESYMAASVTLPEFSDLADGASQVCAFLYRLVERLEGIRHRLRGGGREETIAAFRQQLEAL